MELHSHGHSHEARQEHSHGHEHDHRGHHNWQSATYVKDWIVNDVTKDEERRPLIRQLLGYASQPADAALRILDVGAGYGLLSDEALKKFPKAHVTLQDYSMHMFSHAKERLAAYEDRITFIPADFSKPGWARYLGGPFDVAISGIAIHNLREGELIAQAYREVASAIKPGGVFLDMDYITRELTAEDHVQWLRDGGFAKVEVPWRDEHRAMLVATR